MLRSTIEKAGQPLLLVSTCADECLLGCETAQSEFCQCPSPAGGRVRLEPSASESESTVLPLQWIVQVNDATIKLTANVTLNIGPVSVSTCVVEAKTPEGGSLFDLSVQTSQAFKATPVDFAITPPPTGLETPVVNVTTPVVDDHISDSPNSSSSFHLTQKTPNSVLAEERKPQRNNFFGLLNRWVKTSPEVDPGSPLRSTVACITEPLPQPLSSSHPKLPTNLEQSNPEPSIDDSSEDPNLQSSSSPILSVPTEELTDEPHTHEDPDLHEDQSHDVQPLSPPHGVCEEVSEGAPLNDPQERPHSSETKETHNSFETDEAGHSLQTDSKGESLKPNEQPPCCRSNEQQDVPNLDERLLRRDQETRTTNQGDFSDTAQHSDDQIKEVIERRDFPKRDASEEIEQQVVCGEDEMRDVSEQQEILEIEESRDRDQVDARNEREKDVLRTMEEDGLMTNGENSNYEIPNFSESVTLSEIEAQSEICDEPVGTSLKQEDVCTGDMTNTYSDPMEWIKRETVEEGEKVVAENLGDVTASADVPKVMDSWVILPSEIEASVVLPTPDLEKREESKLEIVNLEVIDAQKYEADTPRAGYPEPEHENDIAASCVASIVTEAEKTCELVEDELPSANTSQPNVDLRGSGVDHVRIVAEGEEALLVEEVNAGMVAEMVAEMAPQVAEMVREALAAREAPDWWSPVADQRHVVSVLSAQALSRGYEVFQDGGKHYPPVKSSLAALSIVSSWRSGARVAVLAVDANDVWRVCRTYTISFSFSSKKAMTATIEERALITALYKEQWWMRNNVKRKMQGCQVFLSNAHHSPYEWPLLTQGCHKWAGISYGNLDTIVEWMNSSKMYIPVSRTTTPILWPELFEHFHDYATS